MPHPTQPASPSRLPRLSFPGLAPQPLSRRARGRVPPNPHPHPRTERVPVLLHTQGKVPGSCGCEWEPVTLRLVRTLPPPESRLGTVAGTAGAHSAYRPPLGHLGWRARAHARMHAYTHAPGPVAAVCRDRGVPSRGTIAELPARKAARERAAGCVSRRRRVLCAAREPAPPARRSRPAAAAAPGATMDTASHSLVLLQQLNMQREFGFLCDCTVAIGDVYFKAHRAVLAAFSNYFKMIFIHQTSECIKIQPTDIQPDIFSYLLHIMYTGKGPKQMVDHSRLEEGIRFLHADYLSHIATEMNQVFSPETVQSSNLYGIQISTTQKTALKQGLEVKEAPCSNSGNRAATQGDHPQLQLSLAIGLDDGTADQQRAHPATQALEEHQKPPVSIKQERCDPESVISQSHPSPSEVTGPTFTESSIKIHLCHYCGERFDSRSNLRQHLHTHVSGSLPFGVPASILESNDLGEVHPLSENSEALECPRLSSFIVKENEEQPDHSNRSTTEPLQISQLSLISKDTEPVELNCNFSFSRKRKISCTICGHKFLRKSQLLEHMYTHKAMSAKCCLPSVEKFQGSGLSSMDRASAYHMGGPRFKPRASLTYVELAHV
ncbi:zinc finger and BTB domain-containing protein 25 isoform X3 [Dasypus novemcinctus]|uniref:zinc finger and BTB domain-containing protein 25 isoform X3 n=1 Tax=Dasypus novemcinctus TaxID=9361 RepID=UPI00265D8701|nr:zinc finger and BTB domain-containing protein 25 isoform X3 [Dasypus novemcinctus]